MRTIARAAGRWAPPILVMGVIFALSSMPGDGEDHGLLYFLSRKAFHLGEYALLAALFWRALAARLELRRALSWAVGLAVLYAVTDELHQTTVPDRVGTPTDVLIDATGASLAALAIGLAYRQRRAAPAL